MGSFEYWKQVREGRFDNVDLGRPTVPAQILATRRRLAETLSELVAEGELDQQMTLAEVIRFLQQ